MNDQVPILSFILSFISNLFENLRFAWEKTSKLLFFHEESSWKPDSSSASSLEMAIARETTSALDASKHTQSSNPVDGCGYTVSFSRFLNQV